MGFLCQHHRHNLLDQPLAAVNSWHKTVDAARQNVKFEHWDKAVVFYGNALEIAQILLDQDADSVNCERYIRTAVELTHAARNSNYQFDADSLFHTLTFHLNKYVQYPSVEYVQPLKDVTYEPLGDVNDWMVQWHQIIVGNETVLH